MAPQYGITVITVVLRLHFPLVIKVILLITYNMPVCKLAICMYVLLRLCVARHWHCRFGRRPVTTTSGVAISTYALSIFFADYCWHCARVCRRFRKSYQPSRFTLSALRSSIYYIRCTNGTCVLQIPPSRPSGTSPAPGYPALSPGPPLSPDKNVHDHLPLTCTAATASCAQVDVQTEWLHPFHSFLYARKRNTAAYRPPPHLRHRARIPIYARCVQHKPLCEIERYAICISSQHTCNLHVGAMTYSPVATRPGPAVLPQNGTAC